MGKLGEKRHLEADGGCHDYFTGRGGGSAGGEHILGKEKSLVKGVETKQCPREEQAAQLAPVRDGPTWNLVRG